MTVDNDGSLLTSLEFFETFGTRYGASLENRVEDDLVVDGPEITTSTRAELAGLAPEGALVGRTIWGGEGAERTGCFLWTGPLHFLIGEDTKSIGDLSDGDVETLEAHLRLNVEEGGDGPMPVEWKPVQRVAAGEVEEKLRKIGIAEECEIATLKVVAGEHEVVFLFATATEEPEEDEEPVEDTAADSAADQAEPSPSGLDVLDEAAGLGLAAPNATGDPTSVESADPVVESADIGNLQHLLDVRMPLTIRLGSTQMNLEKLLRLVPGAILELDQREEEPLEVLANGHVIARGEVVVLDERFGLRITEIGGAEERLRATL